jgi:hypothetical protein
MVVGPMPFRTGQPYVTSELPLLVRKGVPAETRSKGTERGAVPVSSGSVPAGTPIEFVSWVCRDAETSELPKLQRFVSRDGKPLFRFEETTGELAGLCVRIADPIDTVKLGEGSFTYHLWWSPPGGERVEDEIELSIGGAGSGRAEAR